jgi:D-alanyl-D-alanine dipeptidase
LAACKPGSFNTGDNLNKRIAVQEEKSLQLDQKAKEKPVVEPKPKEIKEVNGLVAVKDIDDSIVLDLKYASTDNFIGKKVYPVDVCILQKETANKLAKANEELKKKGYKIKIWDAYRPVYVQQIFWNLVKDSRFVANPAKGGSRHNTGAAVDITLVDMDGKELKMPSKFDDFSINAYRNNSKMDAEAKKNMDLLTAVMKKNEFVTIDTEWWHFEDSDFAKYKIVDVKLDEFY